MADTTTYSGEMEIVVRDYFQPVITRSVEEDIPVLRAFGLANKLLYQRQTPYRTITSKRNLIVGGKRFICPVQLERPGITQELASAMATIDFTTYDKIEGAEFDIALVVSPVGISDQDLNLALSARGVGNEMVELLREKILQATNDHVHSIKTLIHATSKSNNFWNLAAADGTDALITEQGASSAVGKLDSDVHSAWKNQWIATGTFATNDEGFLDALELMGNIEAVGGKTTFILSNPIIRRHIASISVSQLSLRSTMDDPFKGYPEWNGIPIVVDSGVYSSGMATRALYMDMRHIEFWVTKSHHNGRPNFANVLPQTRAPNQLAVNLAIVTEGNLIINCRNKQGYQDIQG